MCKDIWMKDERRMKGAWLVYDGYHFRFSFRREILTFVGVCGVVIRGGGRCTQHLHLA